MAGESSRFFNAGYTVPKYMLPLGNETVFDKSVKSFQKYFDTAYFIFVVRADKYNTFEFVNDHAKLLGITAFEIKVLNYTTRGQAETVFEAMRDCEIEAEYDELVIFNIDTIRHNLTIPAGNFTSYFDAFYDPSADEKKWSFCKVSPIYDYVIEETAEKEKISSWCSTGLYIFGSCGRFTRAYKKAIKDPNYNYYIAPLYNYLIIKLPGGTARKSSNYLLPCLQKDIEFSGVPDEYEALKIKYQNE